MTTPRLALGPLLYYWPRDTLLEFYRTVAESPVTTVYLGETVCAKRRALGLEEWLELGRGLARAGKEVVLSSLALLEAESELRGLRRLCDNGEFLVEANDLGALGLVAGRVPFVAGPSLNVYNPRSLALLARQGMRRWAMPVELSRDTLAAMAAARPEGVEIEVFAFGRLPLAYSARCFTARAHNLPKDDCRLRCLDYPEGMPLKTQEGEPFLTLNGIQTQSARVHSLLPEAGELTRLGVDLLRISPQAGGTPELLTAFQAALAAPERGVELERGLKRWLPEGSCNGYWHGEAGLSGCEEQAIQRG